MKYWVYKESRIIGPFDKEAVSGLPGLDTGTLVCAGDPAGGSWVPAGEVTDLAGLTRADAGLLDDFPSAAGLLDQLQIDSAGLVGDDEFPGALAEELFQDSAFKKGFGDVLSARGPAEESEARLARQKIAELTAQLEALYRHISELESGQTDLSRRLAQKDIELRQRGVAGASAPAAPEPILPAKTFLSPAPPLVPGGPPQVAAVPEAPLPAAEWPDASPAGAAASFPSFSGGLPAAAKASEPPAPPPQPALPEILSLAPAPAPALPQDAAPASPAPFSFGKPKGFKIVSTVKSFKVLGADEAAPGPAAYPAPEFKVEPIVETPAPVAFSPPPPPPVAAPVIAPVVLAPAPVPTPLPVAPAIPAPQPAATNSFVFPVQPATPTPVAPPPNTFSRSQPVPDLAGPDAAAQVPPPATMAFAKSAAAAPAEDAAAARFAKPEPAPGTEERKKPARNNKPFLIGGVVVVILLVIVGVIFMRQPKDDLKQMATLDDGKAPIGLSADEGAAAPPPIVKPRLAEPAPPPPGPSAEHQAAIELVKDFPLDGGRGTVGRWLQYSYTASPGAGAEEWNASATDSTVLVEYRLVPGAAGGAGALYLFEADVARGLVIGKNLEARQMLAGGPPPEAPRAKKKAAAKKRVRRALPEEPKEVPLLPLPDSGELRPPAEDDGSFGSDTINSGI